MLGIEETVLDEDGEAVALTEVDAAGFGFGLGDALLCSADACFE